ncbi:MAG TPA: hypothetical protein VF656_11510 [Pyrinomonadaceae bacterium]
MSKRKTQTRGITAVRAASLWLNAGKRRQARRFADQLLKEGSLPPFAVAQLQAMFISGKMSVAPPLMGTVKPKANDVKLLGTANDGKLPGSAKVLSWATVSVPQVVQLTPNSNSSALGSGDINNSTLVQFMSPPNVIPWWTAMTSNALRPVMLSADTGNAVVTFKQGLTISYLASGGSSYYVLLNGNIVDSNTNYTFTNALLYKNTPAIVRSTFKQQA